MADATGSWLTCAVGEQLALYGAKAVVLQDTGYFEKLPQDWVLRTLGSTHDGGFGDAVLRNDFDEAEHLLDAIEDRALVLKRSLL